MKWCDVIVFTEVWVEEARLLGSKVKCQHVQKAGETKTRVFSSDQNTVAVTIMCVGISHRSTIPAQSSHSYVSGYLCRDGPKSGFPGALFDFLDSWRQSLLIHFPSRRGFMWRSALLRLGKVVLTKPISTDGLGCFIFLRQVVNIDQTVYCIITSNVSRLAPGLLQCLGAVGRKAQGRLKSAWREIPHNHNEHKS
ncbi:hypothetical protein CEXT_755721 [Caerostris extrusa]|uniref:Uncharacterized protein n=1 Tax=Caerostris extrusa TaxID=172846 RepID=A0AAV4TID4_CAEEX|nr:hypothetical protein CEXT_755721 [Caerostris extrusa]